jgi:hypothetical protein
MSNEQNRLLEAILEELKTISAELHHLRNGLKPAPNPDILESNAVAPPNPTTVTLPVAEEICALAVCDWITSKGIAVKNYREQNAGDEVFDQLATFLGERFENLNRVHELIRRNLTTGAYFTLNLSGRSKAEIADSTQFCSMLSSYAFLTNYRYDKNTKIIYATPQKMGIVINFFTGGWFERFIYLKTLSLFTQNKTKFTKLINPQITFPNGDDFELDLLFLVEKQPLWIECKTGDYQNYIKKYSDIRRLLAVPKERAILVILDISDELANHLTSLFDLTVTNEKSFLEKVAVGAGISPDLHPSESIQQPEQIITLGWESAVGSFPIEPLVTPDFPANRPGSLATVLNKATLRPQPECRRQIIEELIEIVESPDRPEKLSEIKQALAHRFQISKSLLQDLLNAVIRSGCLVDTNGQVVVSYTLPFEGLISTDPEVIESKCIEAYTRAVLLTDPDFFDDPEKLLEFERVVGSKAPDPDIILTIKESLASQAT